MRLRGWALALSIGLWAGCGSRFDDARINVATTMSAQGTGTQLVPPFTLAISVLDGAGNCPLSSSAMLTINGAVTPLATCGAFSQPFEDNRPFSLRISDGGDVAEIDVADLAPGTAATLIPDTSIPAGSDFGISIPPELQGLAPGDAQLLDGLYGGWTSAPTTSDGTTVHMQAPADWRNYVLMIPMGDSASADVPARITGCTAFEHCAATAAAVLGPVVLFVSPASTP